MSASIRSKILKAIIFAILGLILSNCGVKGKAQPPLNPAFIGRGQPTYSKATRQIQLKPQNKKIEGDFNEPVDFEKTSTSEDQK